MASSRKPHVLPKLKAMKEQRIPNLVLLSGVPFEGVEFGKVSLHKCVDYNVRDPKKFPEIQYNIFTTVIQRLDGTDKAVMQDWARPLKKSDILSLIRCPHFGQA
jgi:hypothetical protein